MSRDGAEFWVRNKNFIAQFVKVNWDGEEFDVPVHKASSEKRIVVLGESAAHGYPSQGFAFARSLEAMLRAQYPDMAFNFFNMSFPGIDSHILYAEAADAAKKIEPDAFIVYMGNNEMIGPFGAARDKSGDFRVPSAWQARVTIALSRLRLMQLAHALCNPPAKIGANLQPIPLSSPAVATVYANYKRNLNDICETAATNGIPLVLCTVAAALRDVVPSEALDKSQRPSEWLKQYEEGVNLQDKGDFAAASSRFQAAAVSYPDDAELQFRIGQCFWALGNYSRAKSAFNAAGELDATGFARARDPINETVRQTVETSDPALIYFADVERAIESASPNETPGFECFLDQCHLSFFGACVAAESILPQLIAALELDLPASKNFAGEPAMCYCAKALAFTKSELLFECDYRKNYINHYNRFNKSDLERNMANILKAGECLSSDDGVECYRNALRLMPGNYLLSMRLVNELAEAGNLEEALNEIRGMIHIYPCRQEARLTLAQVLIQVAQSASHFGDTARTEESLIEALGICDRLAQQGFATQDALYARAWALVELGRYDSALEAANKVLSVHPENVHAWCIAGRALERLGATEEAKAAYIHSISLDPCNENAFRAYRALLANSLDEAGQIRAWEELAQRFPEAPKPKEYLGELSLAAARYSEAAAAYRAAAATTSCDTAYFRELLYNVLVDCGNRLIDEKRYEEAEPLLKEALDNRMDIGAILGLSTIYEKMERYEEEEHLLRKSILESPEAEPFYARYDDFLYRRHGETARAATWKAFGREHPGLPHLPQDIQFE